MNDKPMKATLGNPRTSAINYGGKKETVATYSALVNTRQGPQAIVSARCCMGRSAAASVVYASVWIYSHSTEKREGYYSGGHGTAGGYGYHKESAAIGEAIESAGITLSKNIAGVGENGIREALSAIVRACGYRGKITILIT